MAGVYLLQYYVDVTHAEDFYFKCCMQFPYYEHRKL